MAEGASGPDGDPVLAFNTLFTESERGSANLRTEGSADGRNYVWCSPRSPYHNCAARTIPVENPLSTPDGHSLRNMREKFQQRRKNPGRDHNLFPSSGSTRATPLRSKKFLARFAAPYYSGPNLGPWNCGNAFSARDLSFLELVVPYESGARRITSNLGSDLFCPLWLVGLAHLEWRARVARSSCIGRRWSVGCSPLVLGRSSWSVWGDSAHGECGGKFSQVWPKLHLLSIWRWKRAPIARLVSLSVIWGGPPVFQVASSQTWGRAPRLSKTWSGKVSGGAVARRRSLSRLEAIPLVGPHSLHFHQ